MLVSKEKFTHHLNNVCHNKGGGRLDSQNSQHCVTVYSQKQKHALDKVLEYQGKIHDFSSRGGWYLGVTETMP